MEYGVLMWISAVYQWLCYLSAEREREREREGLIGSSKWKLTLPCWLWLFQAHSELFESNMKQNAMMLAPRTEGIKLRLAWSHQNALLHCYRSILLVERRAMCRGVANSIITLPSLPLWSETTQPAVLEPLLLHIVNANLNHSDLTWRIPNNDQIKP